MGHHVRTLYNLGESKARLLTYGESNREFGESATIITTRYKEAIAANYDQISVILDRADWMVWLGQSSSKEQLLSVIKPAPVDLLSIRCG
jgi:putative SOS response-associated peptidase YedK